MIFIESIMKTSIYHRIKSSPSEFSDADLQTLIERYDGRSLRGVNAKIAMAACLELDRRKSPAPPVEKNARSTNTPGSPALLRV
jgi:hypothetical protein